MCLIVTLFLGTPKLLTWFLKLFSGSQVDTENWGCWKSDYQVHGSRLYSYLGRVKSEMRITVVILTVTSKQKFSESAYCLPCPLFASVTMTALPHTEVAPSTEASLLACRCCLLSRVLTWSSLCVCVCVYVSLMSLCVYKFPLLLKTSVRLD